MNIENIEKIILEKIKTIKKEDLILRDSFGHRNYYLVSLNKNLDIEISLDDDDTVRDFEIFLSEELYFTQKTKLINLDPIVENISSELSKNKEFKKLIEAAIVPLLPKKEDNYKVILDLLTE